MERSGNCDGCSSYYRHAARMSAGDFTLEEIAKWSYAPFDSDRAHALHMLIAYLIKERDSKPINIEFDVNV